jgi:uncharacterized SAM-binding protein YcdF (DUF218 family)
MIFPLLLLIVVVATLFKLGGFRRSSAALYTIALVTFVVVGCGLAPRLLVDRLQTGYDTKVEKWAAHNDIVLLGAGGQPTEQGVELAAFSYGRLERAFELYRDCKAQAQQCHIISSGGDVQNYGRTEAELYHASLLRLGAAPDDLISESKSLNTWQNAQFTAAILEGHEDAAVVLVTSGLHLKRSAQYFAHFGLHPELIRGDYVSAPIVLLPAAYNFWVMDVAAHEYVGMLRYHVYNWVGLNAMPAPVRN